MSITYLSIYTFIYLNLKFLLKELMNMLSPKQSLIPQGMHFYLIYDKHESEFDKIGSIGSASLVFILRDVTRY